MNKHKVVLCNQSELFGDEFTGVELNSFDWEPAETVNVTPTRNPAKALSRRDLSFL